MIQLLQHIWEWLWFAFYTLYTFYQAELFADQQLPICTALTSIELPQRTTGLNGQPNGGQPKGGWSKGRSQQHWP